MVVPCDYVCAFFDVQCDQHPKTGCLESALPSGQEQISPCIFMVGQYTIILKVRQADGAGAEICETLDAAAVAHMVTVLVGFTFMPTIAHHSATTSKRGCRSVGEVAMTTKS
jgi:hypothetical protein